MQIRTFPAPISPQMPLARYPAQLDPGLYVPFTAPNTSAIYFRWTGPYRIRWRSHRLLLTSQYRTRLYPGWTGARARTRCRRTAEAGMGAVKVGLEGRHRRAVVSGAIHTGVTILLA
jgi:hypothetical protein